MGFQNVNVDRKPLLKKSRFNFSHRTETTLDWGIMTPIHCQRLAVGDSFNNISFSAISRLTTLNAPTLGDIRLRTYWQFVPVLDVYKGFNNFLAQLPRLNSGMATVTPNYLPCVSSSFLMYMLCDRNYSRVAKYTRSADSQTWTHHGDITSSSMATWVHVFAGLKSNCPVKYQPNNTFGFVGDTALYNHGFFEPKTSDFRVINSTSSSSLTGTLFGKYTRRGLNLWTSLVTCGYKPNFTSDDPLDATPLFALYKAYFDIMAPQYKNFEDTMCYSLIRYYDLNGVTSSNIATLANYSDGGSTGFDDDLRTLWMFFFRELSDLVYYSDNDYISSHISTSFADGSFQNFTDLREVKNTGSYRGGGSNLVEDSNLNLLNPSAVSNALTQGSTTLTLFDQCTDEWVKRAYYYANKKSALGMALKSVMMSRGLTNFVENTDSRRIGNTNTIIKINEIINTAETSSMSLGDYAGQSSNNHGSGNFDFKTNEIGFVFGFATIVPDNSHFVNGFDNTLTKITPSDYYSGLFDGLSYEYSSRAVVGKDSALQIENRNDINTSFGLVPRHTDYKVSRDLCTGCFGLRSMRDHLSPYHMARLAYENEGAYDTYTYNPSNHTFTDNASMSLTEVLPSANNAFYRRVDRNTVTGFYDRIFVENDGYQTDSFERQIGYYQSFPTPDVMCQLKINHFADLRMLPVEDSWQTTCDEDDNGKKVSVSKA